MRFTLHVKIESPGNPLLDGAGLRGNVHADLDEVLAFFEFIWKHIALVVNLLERIFSRAVHLELEDIDAIVRVADGVSPAYGGFYFRADVETKQRKNQINNCLIMLFCLVFQVVRYSGKVRLQLFHGQVNVLGIHCGIEMCHES